MKVLAYLAVLLMIFSCGGTKNYTDEENRAYDNLQNLVNSKRFEIISNRARPMATLALQQLANANMLGPGNTAGSIDITSNANFLKMKGDSVSAFFPFYGEQNFGGGSYGGSHLGIEFDAVPENYDVTFDDEKHRANIRFKAKDKYRSNEFYNIYITIFPNYRSVIQVQSTSRTAIEFTGAVKPLPNEDMVQ